MRRTCSRAHPADPEPDPDPDPDPASCCPQTSSCRLLVLRFCSVWRWEFSWSSLSFTFCSHVHFWLQTLSRSSFAAIRASLITVGPFFTLLKHSFLQHQSQGWNPSLCQFSSLRLTQSCRRGWTCRRAAAEKTSVVQSSHHERKRRKTCCCSVHHLCAAGASSRR